MGSEHARELARVLDWASAAGGGSDEARSRRAGGRRRTAESSMPSGLARIERAPSLTERVLVQLRAAIVNAELAPGQPIVIEQLAETLGVSRTPIREALPALQQLGLIEDGDN